MVDGGDNGCRAFTCVDSTDGILFIDVEPNKN
jgi:hypothetical protein